MNPKFVSHRHILKFLFLQFKTMKSAMGKVLMIKLIPLPDDMLYEILCFLFHDIKETIVKLKYKLHTSITTDLVRYEEFNDEIKTCVWGLDFWPHENVEIRNIHCTVCGNFIISKCDRVKNKTNRSVLCTCTFAFAVNVA